MLVFDGCNRDVSLAYFENDAQFSLFILVCTQPQELASLEWDATRGYSTVKWSEEETLTTSWRLHCQPKCELGYRRHGSGTYRRRTHSKEVVGSERRRAPHSIWTGVLQSDEWHQR